MTAWARGVEKNNRRAETIATSLGVQGSVLMLPNFHHYFPRWKVSRVHRTPAFRTEPRVTHNNFVDPAHTPGYFARSLPRAVRIAAANVRNRLLRDRSCKAAARHGQSSCEKKGCGWSRQDQGQESAERSSSSSVPARC